MVIPFVIHSEGLHTVPNWVGTGLEVWLPVGVDRPVEITEATHPFKKLIARGTTDRFGCPMNHDHPNSFFHQSVKLLQFWVKQMATMSGTENHDSGSIFKNRFILGISDIFQDHSFDG